MSRTDKLAQLFARKFGRFVSAFEVARISPLGRTQEVARVRRRGYTVEFVKQGKARGYICTGRP